MHAKIKTLCDVSECVCWVGEVWVVGVISMRLVACVMAAGRGSCKLWVSG